MPAERTSFLTLEEALSIHQKLIGTFGGMGGVRDKGLLESALHRPRTGYYRDLVEMAAALFESLLNNHAFVDGNKRVAFFATDVFLRLNGWRLEVEAERAEADLVGMLSRHEADFDHIVPWISRHIVRVR